MSWLEISFSLVDSLMADAVGMSVNLSKDHTLGFDVSVDVDADADETSLEIRRKSGTSAPLEKDPGPNEQVCWDLSNRLKNSLGLTLAIIADMDLLIHRILATWLYENTGLSTGHSANQLTSVTLKHGNRTVVVCLASTVRTRLHAIAMVVE